LKRKVKPLNLRVPTPAMGSSVKAALAKALEPATAGTSPATKGFAPRMATDIGDHPSQYTEQHSVQRPSGRPGSSTGKDFASVVSHATTPSWRSRSFPVRRPSASGFETPRTIPEDMMDAEQQSLGFDEVCKFGGVASESRWANTLTQSRGAPSSELQRLDEIATVVIEANSQLVNAYLNVKRRSPLPSVIHEGLSNSNSSVAMTSDYHV
jgi:hypothetical protein